MMSFLRFLESKFLPIYLLFLVFFIPLYPKLPLLDVSFTWTYVRLEDFLVAFAYLVFLVIVLARRPKLQEIPLFWWVVGFWGVGFVSTLVAIPFLENGDGYVTYKPHLVVINFLRRIEYMGLFVVYAYVFRDWIRIRKFLICLIAALALVVMYGFGQIFLGFCSFLTMNEEFAKGECLPLQVGGRVSSTFGGHYDLAGYLVLLLPIVFALALVQKERRTKLLMILVLILGFVLMLFTSSRISFAALLVSLGFVGFTQVKRKKILMWGILGLVVLTLILGRNTIIERFSDTIRIRQVTVDPQNNNEILPLPTTQKDWSGLPESDTAILIPFTPVERTNSAYRVYKYEKSEYEKLREMYPDMDITTIEVPNAEIKEKETETKREIIEEKRLLEGNFERRWALVFDISFTTRVQGGWPVAWSAFLHNPITGKGYSTVTAAVDSSYLRALGEVGILGFVSFFGILVMFLVRAMAAVKKYRLWSVEWAMLLGVCGGVIGLLINALLIDIFEASKVAFVLWMLLGVTVVLIQNVNKDANYDVDKKI
jgi:hypothetical protein